MPCSRDYAAGGRIFDRIMARGMMRRIRILILIVTLGVTCLFLPWSKAIASAEDCYGCHGEKGFVTVRDGKELSIYTDEGEFTASVHGMNGIGCDGCHVDTTDIPHSERLAKVDCGTCHDEAASQHAGSVHAQSAACKDCHGAHGIQPAKDPRSRVYALNIPATCGGCHSEGGKVKNAPATLANYESGQHGISTKKGMLGAAVCTDCHGTHKITTVNDPASAANRKNISATCGRCHSGTLTTYQGSIHGHAMAAGNDSSATCSDCHDAHQTLRVDREDFQVQSFKTCGRCHEHAMKSYTASYHGQIADLGFAHVGKCYDCHGSHNILPQNNPLSMISDERCLDTCRKCHPSAEKNFIGFAPHLDHSNKEKFPVEAAVFTVMSALLINVFLIFSIHTLLWFIRAMFAKLKHEDPPHLGNPTGRYFLRFNYYHRITHFLIFTSFVVLSVTGLPLKFHDAQWAKLLAAALGGFEVAGILHRMMGLVTFGYFGLHLSFLAYLLISGRMRFLDMFWGPRSVVPHPQDAIDIADNIKWFLGLGPRVKFGRFAYFEKFDYFAVFWGVAIIGCSGLVLWFPEQVTWFLPGLVVNIAWIIHADEALLATGFIFLIHFYNTHLRVEKFPLDPVILTGRIDEEEMRHERPKEFALRRQDGSLAEIMTTPPPLWMKNFSRAVGWTFVFIGFALLIFMIAAFFF